MALWIYNNKHGLGYTLELLKRTNIVWNIKTRLLQSTCNSRAGRANYISYVYHLLAVTLKASCKFLIRLLLHFKAEQLTRTFVTLVSTNQP